MKKILLVEDDEKISHYLTLELRHEKYSVTCVYNGQDAINEINKRMYDLVILDLMLPKLSGEEVCKKIREESEVPIIVVSAKDSTMTKVNLLDLGADDYITKPFDIQELLARMRVVFRLKKDYSTENMMKYRDIVIDQSTKSVSRAGKNIKIAKTEYKLLEYLVLNREIVLNRGQILNNVWGYDYVGGEKIVDVYIKELRKKVDNPFDRKLIKTIRGFGYVLKDDDDE